MPMDSGPEYISPFDDNWSNAVSPHNGMIIRNQDHYNWVHYRQEYLNADRTTERGQVYARNMFHNMLDSVTLENPPRNPGAVVEPVTWKDWANTFFPLFLVAASVGLALGLNMPLLLLISAAVIAYFVFWKN
jgi:hypothetical protein